MERRSHDARLTAKALTDAADTRRERALLKETMATK
jgi:hypothetical protein